MASPPITPPTIAPVLLLTDEFEGFEAAAVVADEALNVVNGVELDVTVTVEEGEVFDGACFVGMEELDEVGDAKGFVAAANK